MSGWELVFLGTMAIALVAMAVAQMIVAREVAKVARQAAETAQEFRRELRPIVEKAHKIADDATRLTSLALGQMERVDQVMATTAQRVDEVVSSVQDAVVQPIRQGTAVLAGLRAALAIFGRGTPRQRPRDEDDPMFIG